MQIFELLNINIISPNISHFCVILRQVSTCRQLPLAFLLNCSFQIATALWTSWVTHGVKVNTLVSFWENETSVRISKRATFRSMRSTIACRCRPARFRLPQPFGLRNDTWGRVQNPYVIPRNAVTWESQTYNLPRCHSERSRRIP